MPTEDITAVHTHTGKRVDFDNIRPADICIEDIAWSLAGQNRWTAHGNFPWFVTDHSLAVYHRIKRDPDSTPVDHLLALTHDMHEAYESDLNHPLKMFLTKHTDALKHLEARLDRAIAISLGFDHLSQTTTTEIVQKYDLLLRDLEYEVLFSKAHRTIATIALDADLGNRTTQETRAKHFATVFANQLSETLQYHPKIKFHFSQVKGASHRDYQAMMRPILAKAARNIFRKKSTFDEVQEALDRYRKENPGIKITLEVTQAF